MSCLNVGLEHGGGGGGGVHPADGWWALSDESPGWPVMITAFVGQYIDPEIIATLLSFESILWHCNIFA